MFKIGDVVWIENEEFETGEEIMLSKTTIVEIQEEFDRHGNSYKYYLTNASIFWLSESEIFTSKDDLIEASISKNDADMQKLRKHIEAITADLEELKDSARKLEKKRKFLKEIQ